MEMALWHSSRRVIYFFFFLLQCFLNMEIGLPADSLLQNLIVTEKYDNATMVLHHLCFPELSPAPLRCLSSVPLETRLVSSVVSLVTLQQHPVT